MEADELRALQAPLKEQYRQDPDAAMITLTAVGALGEEGVIPTVIMIDS